MESLGRTAYSAAAEYAKSHAGAGENQSRAATQGPSVMSGVSNLFISKCAPAASSHAEDATEVMPASSPPFQDGQGQEEAESPAPSSGYHITVLDLASLLARDDPSVRVISEFIAFQDQSISDLKFTQDGNSLVVSPKDGRVVCIFQIRPSPRVSLPTDPDSSLIRHSDTCPPWHMYDLRRGRTSAIIDGMEVSPDGRWVAVGTRKPTVHIFAINPYGGKPDLRSHMENKVRNTDEAVSNYSFFCHVFTIDCGCKTATIVD